MLPFRSSVMAFLCRVIVVCTLLLEAASITHAAESRIDEARIQASLKKYEEAIAMYNSILKDEPENIDALNGKARVLAWMEKFEDARAVYQKALSIDPSHPESLAGMADTYAWQQNYHAAIALLENSLAENGDNRDMLIRLARYYFWMGEKNKSLSYSSRVLESYPADNDALDIKRKASRLYTHEFYAGYSYLDINNNVDGTNVYAGVRYKPDRPFSLYGQVDYLDRFDEEDVRLLAGSSIDFKSTLTLSAEISFAHDANLYPIVSGWTELAYPLFSSFVLYGSLNLSHYQDIDLYGLSLAGEYYPFGNLAVLSRVTFSRTDFDSGGNADDTSFMIKGTWFFSDEDRLSIFFSSGSESYKIETIDSVGDAEAKTYGISGIYFIHSLIGIAPSFEFQDRGAGTEYLQFGLEFRYRI